MIDVGGAGLQPCLAALKGCATVERASAERLAPDPQPRTPDSTPLISFGDDGIVVGGRERRWSDDGPCVERRRAERRHRAARASVDRRNIRPRSDGDSALSLMDLGSWSAVAVWGRVTDQGPRFPSKRNTWIAVMVWIGAIMCVVGGVAQLSGSAGPMQKGLVLVLLVGGAGFLLWMLYGTSYTFSPGGLRIRCGPFGILVPLSQIGSVVPSRNMLSSPACSLDRLLISYREGRRKVRPRQAAASPAAPAPPSMRRIHRLSLTREAQFSDWTHADTGAPVLKTQHPEFEMWNQGSPCAVGSGVCRLPHAIRASGGAQDQRPPRAQPSAEHQSGLPNVPQVAGSRTEIPRRDDPDADVQAAQPGDGRARRAHHRHQGSPRSRGDRRWRGCCPDVSAPGPVPAGFCRGGEFDWLPRPPGSRTDPGRIDRLFAPGTGGDSRWDRHGPTGVWTVSEGPSLPMPQRRDRIDRRRFEDA